MQWESMGKHYEEESKGDSRHADQHDKVSQKTTGEAANGLFSTLPLVGYRRFSRLPLGMFLQFLGFFVVESERAVVEPHERLAWVRHLGRSSRDWSIQFTALIRVRDALIVVLRSTVAPGLKDESTHDFAS